MNISREKKTVAHETKSKRKSEKKGIAREYNLLCIIAIEHGNVSNGGGKVELTVRHTNG